jgi:hypothetical protein
MLAGVVWPSVLLTAHAVFVWYLWRETTAEVARDIEPQSAHFPFGLNVARARHPGINDGATSYERS